MEESNENEELAPPSTCIVLSKTPPPLTPSPIASTSASSDFTTADAGANSISTRTGYKRQELSFAERIEVIAARTTGKSMRQLALQFGCGKTQILNILSKSKAYQREWEEKAAESNPHISNRKRRPRLTGNEETNRLVWQWYNTQTESGVRRITGPMIQREARAIARTLGINNFAASNGWLDSFRRVHNIGSAQSRQINNDGNSIEKNSENVATPSRAVPSEELPSSATWDYSIPSLQQYQQQQASSNAKEYQSQPAEQLFGDTFYHQGEEGVGADARASTANHIVTGYYDESMEQQYHNSTVRYHGGKDSVMMGRSYQVRENNVAPPLLISDCCYSTASAAATLNNDDYNISHFVDQFSLGTRMIHSSNSNNHNQNHLPLLVYRQDNIFGADPPIESDAETNPSLRMLLSKNNSPTDGRSLAVNLDSSSFDGCRQDQQQKQVAATSKASDDVGDDDDIPQHQQKQNNQSTVLTLSTTSLTAQPTAEVVDELMRLESTTLTEEADHKEVTRADHHSGDQHHGRVGRSITTAAVDGECTTL